MKLAAGYIVFDGLETLEGSLRSIRNQVNIVIVSYQSVSWRGTRSHPDLVKRLESLKKAKLIDHIIEFKNFRPNQMNSREEVISIKKSELDKRQSCLDLARKLGATHYMSMDADECYRESELISTKELIIRENLDATAIHYINYVTPTQHRGYSRWLVPFIYKITPNCHHHAQQQLFKGVDPTRGLLDESYRRWAVLDKSQITMHHMEMVRLNLLAKYESASRYFARKDKLPELVKDINIARFKGELQFTNLHFGDSDNAREVYKLVECPNEFGIRLW